jgi:hypothetical protein
VTLVLATRNTRAVHAIAVLSAVFGAEEAAAGVDAFGDVALASGQVLRSAESSGEVAAMVDSAVELRLAGLSATALSWAARDAELLAWALFIDQTRIAPAIAGGTAGCGVGQSSTEGLNGMVDVDRAFGCRVFRVASALPTDPIGVPCVIAGPLYEDPYELESGVEDSASRASAEGVGGGGKGVELFYRVVDDATAAVDFDRESTGEADGDDRLCDAERIRSLFELDGLEARCGGAVESDHREVRHGRADHDFLAEEEVLGAQLSKPLLIHLVAEEQGELGALTWATKAVSGGEHQLVVDEHG